MRIVTYLNWSELSKFVWFSWVWSGDLEDVDEYLFLYNDIFAVSIFIYVRLRSFSFVFVNVSWKRKRVLDSCKGAGVGRSRLGCCT